MQTDDHDGLTTSVTEQAGDRVGPIPAHWLAIPKFLRPVAKRVRRVGFPPGGQELGPFLGRIPWELRGPVAERFLKPVGTDPRAVVNAVLQGLADGPTDQAIRDALTPGLPESSAVDFSPALDLARWALWWKSLPETERRLIRYECHNPGWQRYFDATTPEQRMRRHRRRISTCEGSPPVASATEGFAR